MTNKEVLAIAMEQSAIDSHCGMEDFNLTTNKVVISNKNPEARRYLELPFECDLTSYGNNIVASVSEELAEIVSDYIERYPAEYCFQTPNLHVLIEALKPFNKSICFMAEYFLPDMNVIKSLECGYETRVMKAKDFEAYYLPEWSNALCEKRKHLDVLGVGAFHEGRLIGLAGCSDDCESMWQIGVDVLPEYRKKGIASCLTSQLAMAVLERGKVPFYCCAWSNIKSARNAIKSGFKPAWVQVTVKDIDFIHKMNGEIVQ